MTPQHLVLVALTALTCGASLAFGVSRTASATTTHVYRLRPDPRMCPSPLCGGYFASELNRTLTTCVDGAARPACHVLEVDVSAVLSPQRWSRLQRLLPSDQVLVAGTLTRTEPSGGELVRDRLVAGTVWRATTVRATDEPIWLVADAGIRCITYPCFWLRASLVNGTRTVTLSSLRASVRTIPKGGVLAAGTIVRVPHAGPAGTGRELVALRVWLPVPPG